MKEGNRYVLMKGTHSYYTEFASEFCVKALRLLQIR